LVSCGQKAGNGSSPKQQGWILKTDSNGCLIDQCWLTGIEEVSPPENITVKVFPNPASAYVLFDIQSSDATTVLEIYDLYGRSIVQKKLNRQTEIRIDTEAWMEGVYIWQVRQQNYPAGQGKLEIMK
jgi:hypothetical protein